MNFGQRRRYTLSAASRALRGVITSTRGDAALLSRFCVQWHSSREHDKSAKARSSWYLIGQRYPVVFLTIGMGQAAAIVKLRM
ncbi:hypothetical protein CY34DRAFT_799795 [Suillus luteus UH-Slu-Lm8-n1]|uniref:Uncharacterized protein n=1 Tax=Suillus luteus UH-Slu-Lm8-n1 TaxID=930992 RepID=A0A0D0AA45_9AGAM|nr:hypothetical protein CY34DRAFT_799795 [Suillus luteus UH-Slu-Lm8-n1]